LKKAEVVEAWPNRTAGVFLMFIAALCGFAAFAAWQDPAGPLALKFFAPPLAVLLLAISWQSLGEDPVMRADAHGITIFGWKRRFYAWRDIARIRVGSSFYVGYGGGAREASIIQAEVATPVGARLVQIPHGGAHAEDLATRLQRLHAEHAPGPQARAVRLPAEEGPNRHPLRTGSRFLMAAAAANILIFGFMAARGAGSPSAAQLVEFGGNFGPALARGEWWRLLSAVFVHAGPVHLLANSFALVQFFFLRNPFDEKRTAAIYLLSGVAGNLLGAWVHPGIVAVGASGAILGLFGAIFGEISRTGQVERKAFAFRSAAVIVLPTLMTSDARADFAGHLGGALAGFLLGYRLSPARKAAVTGPSGRGPGPTRATSP
jgi:rhomboid protease GluP